MSMAQFLAMAWDPEPSIIIGCACLLLGYLSLSRFRMNRKAAFFASGVLLLLMTLIGPLDFLGDDYMFSAHMLEHLMLILPVPVLLLRGLPSGAILALLRFSPVSRIERTLRRPVVAWLLAVGTLWIWHLPLLYNLALANEGIHALEHLTMLVTATIFWWPIFSPLPELRISPVPAIAYIFLAASANMLLGILFTFAPLGYYPRYMQSGGPVFNLVRNVWEIDPRSDLQFGGLFMWVFGGIFYFGIIMAMVARLFQVSDADAAA